MLGGDDEKRVRAQHTHLSLSLEEHWAPERLADEDFNDTFGD
jgi:hypothetical protein